MSLLPRLSALRLEEAKIVATLCARCGHKLKFHHLIHDTQCTALMVEEAPNPSRSKVLICPCASFCETTDEQLAMDA